jgi:alkylation response protein AidB-like acyl-CoA dehydrogenase
MAFGGLDLDPLSVAVIFEELGRGAVPSPLLASSAIATSLLLACRSSERRDAALTAIADGGMILIPALRRPETSWNGVAETCTALTQDQRNWVLTDRRFSCRSRTRRPTSW